MPLNIEEYNALVKQYTELMERLHDEINRDETNSETVTDVAVVTQLSNESAAVLTELIELATGE